jgi:hypothetical protein
MSDEMPVSKPVGDEMPDKNVRTWIFYVLLAFSCAVICVGHELENRGRYQLNGTDSRTGNPISHPLQHGSYGLYLASLNRESRPRNQHTVALLGDSVYQGLDIVDRMQALANNGGANVEFVNLAQTGSSIYDRFVQMLTSLECRPTLIVVSFINIAFSPNWGTAGLPKFRTDNDQMVFNAEVISRMPRSFLMREFSVGTATDSLVSTLFPFKRIDPLARHRVDMLLKTTLSLDLSRLRRALPLPTLNLAGDWNKRRDLRPRPMAKAKPYPGVGKVLEEFLTVCRANGIPVLFLRQESSPAFQPDILPDVREVCLRFPGTRVVDLQPYYNPQDFPDQVHPRKEAQDAYAQRHYTVIQEALRDLAQRPLDERKQ